MVFGGVDLLRTKLDVPRHDLTRWLTGSDELPNPVFLRLVDLLRKPVDDVRPEGDRADEEQAKQNE